MIFLLFACFTSPEKNDETLITIRREKPTRSDYEEVFGDNSSKKGVIIYSYDNEESPFYTQKTDTYTTGSGETFVLDETATLDSDGRWETMTTKSNGVEIGLNIASLRDTWFKTSYLLDNKQTANGLAKDRYDNYKEQALNYIFPENII